MTNFVMNSVSDANRKLHLEISVDEPNTEFEVEVLVRPRSPEFSLPPGYFDLIGMIDDDTFFRHPQGQSPEPVDLD